MDATQRLSSALSRAGYRLTRQRQVVFECLQALDDHPSAEQVFIAARGRLPRISLATVYKALESLVEAGLALKHVVAGSSARYESRVDEHYHMRCSVCGMVRDVERSVALARQIEGLALGGFDVRRVRLDFIGTCSACAAAGVRRPARTEH